MEGGVVTSLIRKWDLFSRPTSLVYSKTDSAKTVCGSIILVAILLVVITSGFIFYQQHFQNVDSSIKNTSKDDNSLRNLNSTILEWEFNTKVRKDSSVDRSLYNDDPIIPFHHGFNLALRVPFNELDLTSYRILFEGISQGQYVSEPMRKWTLDDFHESLHGELNKMEIVNYYWLDNHYYEINRSIMDEYSSHMALNVLKWVGEKWSIDSYIQNRLSGEPFKFLYVETVYNSDDFHNPVKHIISGPFDIFSDLYNINDFFLNFQFSKVLMLNGTSKTLASLKKKNYSYLFHGGLSIILIRIVMSRAEFRYVFTQYLQFQTTEARNLEGVQTIEFQEQDIDKSIFFHIISWFSQIGGISVFLFALVGAIWVPFRNRYMNQKMLNEYLKTKQSIVGSLDDQEENSADLLLCFNLISNSNSFKSNKMHEEVQNTEQPKGNKLKINIITLLYRRRLHLLHLIFFILIYITHKNIFK
jgi:hypothetical protein